MENYGKTRSGVPITEELIQEFSRKAEEGFDLSDLTFEYVCAICEEGGDADEMFGMTLFPARNRYAYQQWWVHPRCILPAFSTNIVDPDSEAIRPEVKLMWFKDEADESR